MHFEFKDLVIAFFFGVSVAFTIIFVKGKG